MATAASPSSFRRQALNEELSVPLVSNFFPIDRYYEAADKVHASFQDALTAVKQLVQEQQRTHDYSYNRTLEQALDNAYVYGKRYSSFCLEAIPEHNYYGAAKYRKLKDQHNKQVDVCLKQLHNIVLHMDAQENEKQRLWNEEQKRLKLEEEKKEAEQFEKLQARARNVLSTPATTTTNGGGRNVQESALNKLELLTRMSSSSSPKAPDPSGQEPMGAPSSRYRVMTDDEDDDDDAEEEGTPLSNLVALPPPAASQQKQQQQQGGDPSAPPSYHDVIHSSVRESTPMRHFLGPTFQYDEATQQFKDARAAAEPGNKGPPSYNRATLGRNGTSTRVQNQPVKQPKRLASMSEIKHHSREEKRKLQQSQRIQETPISTYQGRYTASTNGCTVISALVAARHLQTKGTGITNDEVIQVIDQQCGPILRQVRGKLGLGGAALIIPSDVHDYLVDAKILYQRDFEGVAGGNIMDPEHIGEFLKLVEQGEDGKGQHRKAAATLFFREHVISIVKICTRSSVVYDLIDSMPGVTGPNTCSRTRCHDLPALKVLLQWYASRKLSDGDNNRPWDEAMADFDPRVFQGFVWMVKDKQ